VLANTSVRPATTADGGLDRDAPSLVDQHAAAGLRPLDLAPALVGRRPATTAPDGSATPAGVSVADPVRVALQAAASAPDPSTRFPFRWVDPEAATDCTPAAPDLDDPGIDVAGMLPGPELAELLTQVDPGEASDHALVELTAAAVRLTSWAQAVSSQLAAVLAQRDSMRPDWSVQNPRRADEGVVGEELAMRLAWSRRAAQRLASDGRAFDLELVATGEALARGAIDQPRARVMSDWLAGLPIPVALDVQETVLPRAHRRTVSQLRADVERALIRVDPAEAAARRKQARTGRRVDRPRPLPHEMAGLYAVLPAESAMRMHATLDAAARTARAAGDGRSLDQLRADGLTDLVLHTACEGDALIVGSGDAVQGDPPDGAASHGTWLGDTPPGRTELGPNAPARNAPARTEPGRTEPGRTAPDGPELDDDASGNGALDDDVPESGALDDDAPDSGALHDDVPGGMASEVVEVTSAGSAGRTPCPSRRRPVTQIHVTVAMSTLLGLDDQPADLAGYGPVSAETARALAEGGVWQRLVTDPLSGAVLDLGRTRYRPSAALAAHVRARDRTCVQPSCSAPAASCDLDHTREFHAQRGRDPSDEPLGTTSADNLEPLCHRDHLVKTEGGFRLRQRAPGEFVWVTPTGHVYEVQPGVDVDPPDLRPAPPDTRSEFLRSLPPPPGPDAEPPY
jgi:hypothetical protein